MVTLASPPPKRPVTPRNVTLSAKTRMVRIYNPTYLEPNGFNHFGPRSRFDHHQESDPPTIDTARAIYYAAPDLAGCVIEVFGDTGVIEPDPYYVALVELTRNLTILDLTGDGAWLAGSIAALTKDSDRKFSQRWARHFYDDLDTYGQVDGIQFGNAHNDALAYALFERALPLEVLGHRALSDPLFDAELAQLALELGLVLNP